jgi:hypothetical protein
MVISFCHFVLGFIAIGYRHRDQFIGSWLPPFLSLYFQESTACFKQKPPKDKNLLAVTG